MLYDLFADPKVLGAPADRIALLTTEADAKRNGRSATRANVLAAVRTAVEQTASGDTIVLALFGRGASVGDATCLFTTDTTFKDRGKTGLLGTDLAVALKTAQDRRLCLLLDVHFKGFDAGKEAIVEPTFSDVLKGVFGTEERGEEAPLPTNKLFILSAIPGYDPVAKGENGLFATVLADALRGQADVEGYEPDGVVTTDEVVTYLEREATKATRELGTTVKEKEAVPYIVGEETSHFVLTRNKGPAAVADAKLKAFDAAVKPLPPDVAAEGRRLLQRMPKLKSEQTLRKKYQAFADGQLTAEGLTAARTEIVAARRLPAGEAEVFTKAVIAAGRAVEAEHLREVRRGELAAAAVIGLYRRLEVDMPAEVARVAKRGKDLSASETDGLVTAARTALGVREDLEGGKDADLAITMMLASLNDPYTVYYDKETIKKIESGLRGEFRGVGIQIRRDLVRDGLLVVTPILGSPAYKAGVKAGDLITEIRRTVDPTGQPLASEADKVISTKGMKTDRALDLILGKPGVPVSLVVERANATGPAETLTFELNRAVVSVETVLGVRRRVDDSWDYLLDEKKRIAYIQLNQFSPSTHAQLKTVLTALVKDGLNGLVLDLRYNPGGLLMGAVLVADMFLPDGQILEMRPRVGKVEKYSDQGYGTFTGFPMAVLVNGKSASASEIVSAALEDYSRAVVVGERTYGKGSVQQVRSFGPTKGEIKLTTSRYFPPLGRNIDRLSTGGSSAEEWGVRPTAGYEVVLSQEENQVLIESFRDHEIIPRRDAKAISRPKREGKDRQLETAVEYVRKKLTAEK
jgi:C-terminal peptidase prc